MPADVDGDGITDAVYLDFMDDHAVLGVCTGSGISDSIPSEGQGEVLQIIDVDQDGKDEVFFGGTSIGASIDSIAEFVGGSIVRVRRSDGAPIIVVEGLDPGILSSHHPAGAAFGCEDVDGDGSPELASVTVSRSDGRFQWRRVDYDIAEGHASIVSRESGHRRNRPKRRDRDEVVTIAHHLVAACPVKAQP
ncbi:MAG: hypothetical protein M3290_05385 [Actinomycetota bacterium]|nr:hypothetical protein [Actinomycetota bacterium]